MIETLSVAPVILAHGARPAAVQVALNQATFLMTVEEADQFAASVTLSARQAEATNTLLAGRPAAHAALIANPLGRA